MNSSRGPSQEEQFHPLEQEEKLTPDELQKRQRQEWDTLKSEITRSPDELIEMMKVCLKNQTNEQGDITPINRAMASMKIFHDPMSKMESIVPDGNYLGFLYSKRFNPARHMAMNGNRLHRLRLMFDTCAHNPEYSDDAFAAADYAESQREAIILYSACFEVEGELLEPYGPENQARRDYLITLYNKIYSNSGLLGKKPDNFDQILRPISMGMVLHKKFDRIALALRLAGKRQQEEMNKDICKDVKDSMQSLENINDVLVWALKIQVANPLHYILEDENFIAERDLSITLDDVFNILAGAFGPNMMQDKELTQRQMVVLAVLIDSVRKEYHVRLQQNLQLYLPDLLSELRTMNVLLMMVEIRNLLATLASAGEHQSVSAAAGVKLTQYDDHYIEQFLMKLVGCGIDIDEAEGKVRALAKIYKHEEKDDLFRFSLDRFTESECRSMFNSPSPEPKPEPEPSPRPIVNTDSESDEISTVPLSWDFPPVVVGAVSADQTRPTDKSPLSVDAVLQQETAQLEPVLVHAQPVVGVVMERHEHDYGDEPVERAEGMPEFLSNSPVMLLEPAVDLGALINAAPAAVAAVQARDDQDVELYNFFVLDVAESALDPHPVGASDIILDAAQDQMPAQAKALELGPSDVHWLNLVEGDLGKRMLAEYARYSKDLSTRGANRKFKFSIFRHFDEICQIQCMLIYDLVKAGDYKEAAVIANNYIKTYPKSYQTPVLSKFCTEIVERRTVEMAAPVAPSILNSDHIERPH